MAVTPLNKGSASPDKKRIIILLLLGVAILVVYKKSILDKSQSSLTPGTSIVGETTQLAPVPTMAESTTSHMTLLRVPVAPVPPAPENTSWGRDPFAGTPYGEEKPVAHPPAEKPVPGQQPQKSAPEILILSGIGWSKNRTLAIINGQVVHEGEVIASKGKKIYKVISILKNRVVIDNNGVTIILRVRGGR